MKVALPALALAFLAGIATAQPPPRVRGVVQALEGNTLVVETGVVANGRRGTLPGATIMALAAPADGGATAVAIIAETNGVKPPMYRLSS